MPPLFERFEDVAPLRRRLYFRMDDGTQRAVIVRQSDDSPELRARTAQALAAESRRLVGRRPPTQP